MKKDTLFSIPQDKSLKDKKIAAVKTVHLTTHLLYMDKEMRKSGITGGYQFRQYYIVTNSCLIL